jgi:hypothetical protein
MIGSVERVWRHMSVPSLVPIFMLVMVVRNPTPTDPNRRGTGYGGVVPVPVPSTASNASTRPDPIIEQQHRDQRSARGRVLYATGRAPSTTTASRSTAKPQCERRVVEGRSPTSSPNS